MPRSTRHKSSKHKDARDYSDSEKESSLKERKSSKEESSARVSKDSASGDKRKLDSKEYYDSTNGEYYEEYTSSKRRKGKAGDSGSDRWNGKDEEKGESSKKTKASSEKSRRREEVVGEETKKSSGKSDGKHRESSRRESKEFDKEKDREKERKHKEGKSDKFHDGEDHHKSKAGSVKTELKAQDQLDNHTEKRSRRKKDDHGVGDKHQDNSDDVGDRLTSGDDYIKDGKQKGEKSRDKYRDDKEEDIKQKGDKQRDDRPTKEQTRSDEKHLRDESKKKSKLQDNDHGHEPDSEHDGYHDRDRNRDYDRESDRNERDRERARERDRDYERDRERDRERERDRDRRDYEHDRYHERDWDRDRSRDRDRDHDRDRAHDREKDRSRDYYHDGKRSKSDRERDNDRDDQSGRYKDRREGRKSPDYQDYQEVIIGSRSSRPEPDVDVIRSERQPSSSAVQEENGNVSDQITKGVSSREAAELSGGSERGSRHKVSERTIKLEDGVLGEFQAERSSAPKASPRPMVERSPSSTSLDRRYNNRSGARRSLEVEETGHRSSGRDFSAAEDERNLADGTSQAELSFNNKANQNNSSFPPRPESRGGISSPRVGPREEDNRVNAGGRYKRGVDPMMGRGQSNVWRGVPNWPSPLPNGFIQFQHVPQHGGFQAMMPQFSSPSIFGVRPSMEMNHPGIPYHIPDAERFSGHMRPLGWQNMMDGSGASHMHGFFGDMSNSVFRDESNMYAGSEWDHNRRMHGRGWESGADEWKTRNGDASMEVSSMSVKDDNSAQVADDESLGGQTSHSENDRAKSVEAGSNATSPAKEVHASSPNINAEVVAEDPVTETADKYERYCRHYLSKLDISVELADPELRECISLLVDEERLTMDDGAAVFVNLKEGGKRVTKSNSTSLKTLSLFPSQNSSVFKMALDLYKEQRFEIKGLPNIENHEPPPQVSPSNIVKVDNNDNMNDVMKGNSFVETADVETADVSDSDTSQKEQPKVSSPIDAGMEIETQYGGGLSPSPEKSPEALEAVASDHIEAHEEDAKADEGADVDQTMETAPEHDGATEGDDPVTLTIASPAPVAIEIDEQNDLVAEDENMEEAEEKKEADDGDGNGVVIVGDVSPKVTEPLVHESDESVISRIHHSPQSTH
uniref:Nipped-B-like protein B n=1 Tax=Noccaea caerulescens TaxID=107243 RepID=A0A1J3HM52_NOCCA